MAYITGYTYDIFISYAHVDNETIFGKHDGWIEQFYKNLNLLLAKRMGRMDTIKIWWDSKKLDGSRLFDKSIEDGIEHSAIMISVVSPGYLASKYCMSELDLFYKKAQKESVGLHVGNRSRILNVLLNNIPYAQWPQQLSGTTGFHFHDSSQSDDFGDPIDMNNSMFNVRMKELRDCIIGLCDNFSGVHSTPSSHAQTDGALNKKGFTIFFGEVADTLRSVRKRAITDLEKKGYNIIYGVPPPDEAEAHEKKVISELERSDLTVHLLDVYPGRDIKGAEDTWYPQKQAELALQHAPSKIIWTPAELETDVIEEEKYKTFLKEIDTGKNINQKYEYIKGAKSTISQEITDIAEQLKAQQKQKEIKGKLSVLLDTHFNDQLYAMDVGKALLENHIQPFINPQEDDPRKNINLLAERISQVSKLIFFYGIVSRDWVFERMSAALQELSVSNQLSKAFIADADLYFSDIKDVVEIRKINKFERQNINSGEFKIFGIQSNLYYSSENFQASLNYSYTHPRQTKDSSGTIDLIVADIAIHKANLITNYSFLNHHYNINFRVNYVGSKKAGENTTVKANPISLFDSYILGNLTMSANDILQLKGIMVQFTCNNIFNKIYYSPGIVGAGGADYPGSILQMKRNFSGRVIYKF